MKKVAIGFTVLVLIFGAFVVWRALSSPNYDVLAIGNFVVLALTLITLVLYAYDTNAIARVSSERWKREGVLSTTYEIVVTGNRGEPGRTLFRIHNPSTLVVRARVVCNFRLYGDPIMADPPYSGKETWFVFPHQISQGWFEIEALLQKKGKTVAAMIGERTPANCSNQFTMNLELEFRDELGERRTLPARQHYFDFDAWLWIPVLTQSGERT